MSGLKLITCFILLYTSFPLLAEAKEPLLFVVNHPGSAPYLYFDTSKKLYQGVIPDILQDLIKSNQINVKYISNSRKRSEEYMYQGTADLMMLSKAWLKNPDRLIATIPLHQHRGFLYKASEFSDDFSLVSSTDSNTMCTRKGYFYPNLAPYFKSKRFVRIDSSDHLSMLRMLFKQRCDYMVMNEFNALNLVNSSFFQEEKLFRSKSPISIVPLNIILRAELTDEKQILDKHIRFLQESGELQRILDRHTNYSK